MKKQLAGLTFFFAIAAVSGYLGHEMANDKADLADTLIRNSAALTAKMTDDEGRSAYEEKLGRVIAGAITSSRLVNFSVAEPFADTNDYNFKVVFADMPFQRAVYSLFDREYQTFYVSDDIDEQAQIATLAAQFRQLAEGAYNHSSACVFADVGEGDFLTADAAFDPRKLTGGPAEDGQRNCYNRDFSYSR